MTGILASDNFGNKFSFRHGLPERPLESFWRVNPGDKREFEIPMVGKLIDGTKKLTLKIGPNFSEQVSPFEITIPVKPESFEIGN